MTVCEKNSSKVIGNSVSIFSIKRFTNYIFNLCFFSCYSKTISLSLSLLVNVDKCPFALQMQCNIFFEHGLIRFIQISISHLKDDKKKKEKKDILIKFTTMTPVNSRESCGKKITLSLTDKVNLLDLHK